MKVLHVRVASRESVRNGILKAWKDAEAGKTTKARPCLTFRSYDDMHRVLAPARLDIVKTLTGHKPMSIREVARRVNRGLKGVHTDVTTLINAGVVDRTDE